MIPQVFVYCTSWRKRQLKCLRLHSHNKYILVKRLRKRKTRVQQVEALFPSILLENQTAPVWLTEQRQSWEPGLFHFPVNTLPSLLLHPAPAACEVGNCELLSEDYQRTPDSSSLPTGHSGRQTSYVHVARWRSDSKVEDKKYQRRLLWEREHLDEACEQACFQCAPVKSC